MEMLMKIMPYMLPIFAFLVQAALGVYFIASSLYRIAQQSFIHRTMKPVTTDASPIETEATPIEAELIDEEPPVKEVPNQRSKKAIAAQDERRKAREERSKQRKSGRRSPSPKSESPKTQKSKNEAEQNPIQSKRTSGDGRTKKRRK
jgi:membrane protein insertase Oxa1/YidC/SpoIIIJ